MRCYTFRHDVKGFSLILTKGRHVLVVHESECLLPSHRAAVESPTAIAFARQRHKRTHNILPKIYSKVFYSIACCRLGTSLSRFVSQYRRPMSTRQLRAAHNLADQKHFTHETQAILEELSKMYMFRCFRVRRVCIQRRSLID